jgi:hypothetical protein
VQKIVCQFKVFLTHEKAQEWISDTMTCIKSGQCTKSTLDSLIGRFNQKSMIIHIGQYFLPQLCHCLHKHSYNHKNKLITLLPWEIKDLKLWVIFINYLSQTGIISTITYSDACKWDIGGYTIHHGNAWRYFLPTHLQSRASINLLESIAAIVTIHLSITKDPQHSTVHPYILAFTDNSSTVGWLFNSTFNPAKDRCHDDIAQFLACLLFQHNVTLHLEHILDKDNDVV